MELTLASKRALCGLRLDRLRHITKKGVDIIDTSDKRGHGILGVLASLAFLQNRDAILFAMAFHPFDWARVSTVTVVLHPRGLGVENRRGGDGGDGRSGGRHCWYMFVCI